MANHQKQKPAGDLRAWRGVWIAYWFVAWTTTALFLLVATTSDGNAGGWVLPFSFSVTLAWTLLGWTTDLLMLLLTPRNRSFRLPLVANCLLATLGRIWCLEILAPILAGY